MRRTVPGIARSTTSSAADPRHAGIGHRRAQARSPEADSALSSVSFPGVARKTLVLTARRHGVALRQSEAWLGPALRRKTGRCSVRLFKLRQCALRRSHTVLGRVVRDMQSKLDQLGASVRERIAVWPDACLVPHDGMLPLEPLAPSTAEIRVGQGFLRTDALRSPAAVKRWNDTSRFDPPAACFMRADSAGPACQSKHRCGRTTRRAS